MPEKSRKPRTCLSAIASFAIKIRGTADRCTPLDRKCRLAALVNFYIVQIPPHIGAIAEIRTKAEAEADNLVGIL